MIALLPHKYWILAPFLVILNCVLIAEDIPKRREALPIVELYVIRKELHKSDRKVSAASSGKLGYISSRPDLVLKEFLEVIIIVPKELRKTSEGKLVFVNGNSDLMLNLHEKEFKLLEAIHSKVGDIGLFLKISVSGKTRYFDAEFGPIRDDTIFVEGTEAEKHEISELLQQLVTERSK